MLKFLIVGAGSIGIFLGTKLYHGGHEVLLYGRRKLSGLTDSILINDEAYPLPPKCDQLAQNDYNGIFMTPKLYDVKEALAEIREAGLTSQIMAFIQNGILPPDFYEEFRFHPGFLTLSIFNGYHLTNNQLRVRESQWGWQTEANETGEKISQLLNAVGIRCYTTSNLAQMRAIKLICNSALNALSAVENKTIGELVSDPQFKTIVDELIYESWAVLDGDYNLPPLPEVKDKLYGLVEQIKDHYSSLHHDLISGRKTEIDFLNGFIVELGKEKGIPTPFHQDIYQRVIQG